MIISTGMRTDIPAFYSQWLLNRIREGYVLVRNPYNEHQVTKYLLNPNIVDCMCFCTKNPAPLLPYVQKVLATFHQFWFVTITPYGKEIEPNVPEKKQVINSFIRLSQMLGRDAVGWRYDPIFYGFGWDKERHIAAFREIAEALRGYTNYCVISILDLYPKVCKNAPEILPPTRNEQLELLKEFVTIARQNGITIKGCYEWQYLESVGVDCSGCQTKGVLEKAIGGEFVVPHMQSKNPRGACNCLLGSDIGAYNSCGHLCKYCYANADKQTVLANIKRHNPLSPFLIGEPQPDDKISEAKQKSWLNLQTDFFTKL